jgi:hypothetical protein
MFIIFILFICSAVCRTYLKIQIVIKQLLNITDRGLKRWYYVTLIKCPTIENMQK